MEKIHQITHLGLVYFQTSESFEITSLNFLAPSQCILKFAEKKKTIVYKRKIPLRKLPSVAFHYC